jgi:hypothetical protein
VPAKGLSARRIFEDAIRRVVADDRAWWHETSICDRAVPDFVTSLSWADEVTAGSRQDATQLTIERRGHSRRGHHRHGLRALCDDVHLDLVTRRGEPVLRRDRGSEVEHGKPAAQKSAPRCSTAARHSSTTTLRLRRPTPPGSRNSFAAASSPSGSISRRLARCTRW